MNLDTIHEFNKFLYSDEELKLNETQWQAIDTAYSYLH